MNLSGLVKQLTHRLQLPLPGEVAHEPLRATPVGELKPKFTHSVAPKLGSVLILLYEENGQIKFPLTKRPDYLGAHGGQVSFPGGKAEPGETKIETALREGEEEIGVPMNLVNVVGNLSDFFVIPSNFMITPVIGYTSTKPRYVPQESEVVRIIEGNLSDLIEENAVRVKEILAAKTYRMMAPHFLIEDEIVWGATAMMLNEFRMIVREINPIYS